MPQILNNNVSRLLVKFLHYILGVTQAQIQAPSFDTTFYIVTMADATPEQQDITSMAFLVSLIMRAATTEDFKASKELQQFIVDLHRNQEVRDNGAIIKVDDPTAILNRWTREAARTTGLPEEKIRAVLTTLNQGAGYGAVASMLAEGGMRADKPVLFTANFSSPLSKSYFDRNGNTFTYYRAIPMHALTIDPAKPIDTEPDPEHPDLVVTTKVTIKLDYFKLPTQPTDSIETITAQPGAVTQTSAVQMRDPDIRFNSALLPKFSDCEVMGFQFLPDADLFNEQEWVLAPRPTS